MNKKGPTPPPEPDSTTNPNLSNSKKVNSDSDSESEEKMPFNPMQMMMMQSMMMQFQQQQQVAMQPAVMQPQIQPHPYQGKYIRYNRSEKRILVQMNSEASRPSPFTITNDNALPPTHLPTYSSSNIYSTNSVSSTPLSDQQQGWDKSEPPSKKSKFGGNWAVRGSLTLIIILFLKVCWKLLEQNIQQSQ